MKAMVNAWVLGGDGRYPWAVRRLRGDGLPIRCWGVPEMEDQAESLEEAAMVHGLDADVLEAQINDYLGA